MAALAHNPNRYGLLAPQSITPWPLGFSSALPALTTSSPHTIESHLMVWTPESVEIVGSYAMKEAVLLLKAKMFRAFWGTKAELRSFKDATITKTAVWECQGWQRHLIIQEIIEHVLQRHLSLKPESLHVVAGQLDFALLEKGQDSISTFPKLMEVYETFAKRLRGIEDLPLKVVTVQPVSPAFWHADVFPPQPHPLAEDAGLQKIPSNAVPLYLKPIEVMLQLEGSGDWPAAPVAIQKTKTAFCLQIAQSLQKKWGVGCVATEDAVDIMMEGYVFRLKIMYDKDPTRVMATKIDKQLGTIPTDQDLLLRSTHSSLLRGLHNVYHAYGPCVRLAKR